MAGKITALKTQKRTNNRYNVYIDDQYAFAVTALVASDLRIGQHLSDSDIAALQEGDHRDKAYHRALRWLGYRARSEAEMEQYLRDKGYTPEVVADTLDRLRRQNYLNDEAFARAWLDSRERSRPRGERALRYELGQKGIDRDIIDDAVADLDEDALAWKAIQAKLRQWQGLDRDRFQKKVLAYLSRRGFSYQVARQVYERAWSSLE